jgi:hypothetical protein
MLVRFRKLEPDRVLGHFGEGAECAARLPIGGQFQEIARPFRESIKAALLDGLHEVARVWNAGGCRQNLLRFV